MANRKPNCGAQAQPTDGVFESVLGIISVITGLFSLFKAIGALLEAGQAGTALLTLFGISVTAYAASAAAGALLTLLVVVVFVVDRCSSKGGVAACGAGVVNALVPSFASASDYLFPFTAMHDRVDVVAKSIYWSLISTNAQTIHCNNDSRQSPILHCFYESAEVCRAGTGALIGAIIGAVAGIILGAAIGAAIGCATVILCIAALVVALIVAVAAVLVGALLVGLLSLVAGSNTAPAGTSGSGTTTLVVGHYVTVNGNFVVHDHLDGAVAAWFVTSTTLHGGPSTSGEGPGGGAPYPHTDPDTNLVPDACPP